MVRRVAEDEINFVDNSDVEKVLIDIVVFIPDLVADETSISATVLVHTIGVVYLFTIAAFSQPAK